MVSVRHDLAVGAELRAWCYLGPQSPFSSFCLDGSNQHASGCLAILLDQNHRCVFIDEVSKKRRLPFFGSINRGNKTGTAAVIGSDRRKYQLSSALRAGMSQETSTTGRFV
jgi:hypothetical protein